MSPIHQKADVGGYFFEELKRYVGFDADSERALLAMYPVVQPHFGAVVEAFYDALSANPRTRAVFESEAQIERLRGTLHRWMEEGFSGPWDASFFARRRRIGRIHVEVGLLPHFMSGAMNIVRRHLLEVIHEAGLDFHHIASLERWLDLELAVMNQSYWDHMMELKLTVPVALATGLAHEIRNPLNAIGLNLKILERRLHALGAEESIHVVEAVRNEVRRITGLTSEIMDFAKPVDLHPAWHRADRFLDELEMMHGPSFEAAGVAIHVRAGAEKFFCDIDRMRQALVNLLTNAVEAVEPGGEVTLSIEDEDDTTAIRVADTGHGMEPALAYRIFDLFYTQKASGTGLGLPIVKNIVEAHGGTIDVTTRPDHGSTFIIRIPRPNPSQGENP